MGVYGTYTPKSLNSKAAKFWVHFLREKDGHSAKCKICNKIIVAAAGSTSGLRNHLHGIHKMTFDDELSNEC